jgi:hypothetical protein
MTPRYTFTERKTIDKCSDGRIFVYFDEKEETEKIVTEQGQDEYPVWTYKRAETSEPLTKSKIVDAIIRVDYSQADVEAIFRHKLAGMDDEGEFHLFNIVAERAKERANEVLSL